MELTQQLRRTLVKAGVRPERVSIGDPADKRTWAVTLDRPDDAVQAALVQQVIDGLDPAAPDPDLVDEDQAHAFDHDTVARALAIWVAKQVNVPIATARAEILAIARGL